MINRRQNLVWLSTNALSGLSVFIAKNSLAQTMDMENWKLERDQWIEATQGSKSFNKPAILSKFSDGVYYLRAPISYSTEKIPLSVQIPTGFVTDLASIPRPFWSLVPRDGPYADAAIVHDYLYWQQKTTRDEADMAFLYAMEELEVSKRTAQAIYTAVRSSFGERAWLDNKRLRNNGEIRQLARLPEHPKIKWSEWKKEPTNLSKT